MDVMNSIQVIYSVTADSKSEAERIAENISIEQSVEMPYDIVPEHLKGKSVASLESLKQANQNHWLATIKFPGILFGDDPSQLLNVIFGNSSLQPGIKVVDIDSTHLEKIVPGPAFGIDGIRKRLNVYNRSLSCTALKPVGLTPAEFAERAYLFSRGGMDLIKDDHGLTNQESAPFRSRVISCVRAVRKGEQISGKKTLYFPNITTSPARVLDRYYEAVELGADGVLISAQLAGPEILCELSKAAEVPVMAHPAFSGSLVIHESGGISAPLYYGTLWRAFGADCVIYPNARGRFTFSIDLCREINNKCRSEITGIKPALPVPGGGISRDSLSFWINEYGKETIFLIGGSLYQHPDGLELAASEFQTTLQSHVYE